jgi:4-amino-4-deoxy-L-arabinose transferase-like glycosyltransferase
VRDVAHHFANGDGYVISQGPGQPPEVTAINPPVHTLFITALDVLGFDDPEPQRVALSLFASVGVLLMGLVGRRLGGAAVGLTAAAIAAFHPMWTQPPGILMAEAEYLVMVPLVLLLALRALDRPSTGRLAALGAGLGLTALTRSEGVLLVLLLAGPVVFLAVRPWKDRLVAGAVVAVAFGLILGPWVVRNYRAFGGLTLSNNAGVTLLGTYCHTPYEADELGSWDANCFFEEAAKIYEPGRPEPENGWNEYEENRAWAGLAADFVWSHQKKTVLVMGAKVGRMWGFYASEGQYDFDVREIRDPTWQRVGQILNFVLLGLGIIGAALLPRRWWRRWSLIVALPIIATATAAIFLGTTRSRITAEPAIALFAAVGIVLLATRARGALRTPPEDDLVIDLREPAELRARIDVPVGYDTRRSDDSLVGVSDGGEAGAGADASGSQRERSRPINSSS